jgi:hypothetical protein
MCLPTPDFTITARQTEVVAALTFDFTDQIDPQRVMVFHSMAHIEPKGVDAYILN